jgi:uncharacterized lipoprotein YehR (DUF1307 family)
MAVRMRRRWVPVATVVLALVMAVSLTACPHKGPAQRAGEKVDKALGTK